MSDRSTQELLSEEVVSTTRSAPATTSTAVVPSYAEPLYLPGRIVYVEEDEETGILSAAFKNKLSFGSILVSPRLVLVKVCQFRNNG